MTDLQIVDRFREGTNCRAVLMALLEKESTMWKWKISHQMLDASIALYFSGVERDPKFSKNFLFNIISWLYRWKFVVIILNCKFLLGSSSLKTASAWLQNLEFYLTDDYLLLNFDLYETLKSVCTNLSNARRMIFVIISIYLMNVHEEYLWNLKNRLLVYQQVCSWQFANGSATHFQQEPPFENGVLVPGHQNKQEQNAKARCLHICGTNRCLEQVSKYKFQANFAPFSSKNS
ncbi:hypothetical protein T07_13616 [Trichinella nelsoni]|uniref:Uncharacterized protein n=1 Tax=Trichinella nelsoni TaxID=6336 RepID=A0A0V0SFF1_9BILA|nr:hypothetical protein T07_13616 [Trichinella nelsoni]